MEWEMYQYSNNFYTGLGILAILVLNTRNACELIVLLECLDLFQ